MAAARQPPARAARTGENRTFGAWRHNRKPRKSEACKHAHQPSHPLARRLSRSGPERRWGLNQEAGLSGAWAPTGSSWCGSSIATHCRGLRSEVPVATKPSCPEPLLRLRLGDVEFSGRCRPSKVAPCGVTFWLANPPSATLTPSASALLSAHLKVCG
jgi:hypothetical protein